MERILEDMRTLEDEVCAHIRLLLPDAPVYFYWAENKINVYVFALSPQGHVCRGAFVLLKSVLTRTALDLCARSIHSQLEIVCGERIQTISLSLKKAIESGS